MVATSKWANVLQNLSGAGTLLRGVDPIDPRNTSYDGRLAQLFLGLGI